MTTPNTRTPGTTSLTKDIETPPRLSSDLARRRFCLPPVLPAAGSCPAARSCLLPVLPA
ncbi:hypothetical protein ACH4MT_03535 [Streptomyces anulatus]